MRISLGRFALFACAVVSIGLGRAVEASVAEKDHYKGGEHDPAYDHDAFLGKDGAQEWEELSPEKAKEKLAKLIPKIDGNSDGVLNEEELKAHINFMQRRYVENDVKRAWGNYENDEIVDGKLTWKGHRERVYGKETEEVTEEYAKMIKRDRARWQAADQGFYRVWEYPQNGDDMLTLEEYECFTHPEDCKHMQLVVVKETMEDIDKDGDEKISLEEYLGDMYRPEDYPELKGAEPEWVQSEREMFKEHRDKNGDGLMDTDEMKEWISPTDFDHAEAEAHHLVHMADDDKDGVLSMDEIMAHYDVFVGSQATDYGEQLQKHDPSEL